MGLTPDYKEEIKKRVITKLRAQVEEKTPGRS